jgi:hypothetical protein
MSMHETAADCALHSSSSTDDKVQTTCCVIRALPQLIICEFERAYAPGVQEAGPKAAASVVDLG